MKRFHFLLILALVFIPVILSLPAMAEDYYVNASAPDDSGDGSLGAPWKTITHAAGEVDAGTSGSPNQIHVAAGTYDTVNGEDFPISLNNDYVSLIGDTTGITRIQGQGAGETDNLLVIDNNDGINVISIQNLTFAGAREGILSYNGGLSLINNIFEDTIAEGLHLGIDTSSAPLSVSFSVAAVTLTGNTFNCTEEGAYIYVDLYFDDAVHVPGPVANLGGIIVSDNTFNIAAGQTGLAVHSYSVQYLNSGSIAVGPVSVTGNTFTGGDRGFDFSGNFAEITNPALAVGNFEVSTNTFTDQTGVAMSSNYYDIGYLHQAGTAALGSLTIHNNTITTGATSGFGIQLNAGNLHSLYDSVSITTGPITISGNTITARYEGIDLSYSDISTLGASPADTATVNFGATTISGNTVTSSISYGIFLKFQTIGSSMAGATMVNFGAVALANNNVTGTNDGILLIVDNVGSNMADSSQLTMSPFSLANNAINAGCSSIYIDYVNSDAYGNGIGAHNTGNAIATLPSWNITGNVLDSTGTGDACSDSSGIYFWSNANPYNNSGGAAVHFGSLLIDNNTFNPDKNTGMNNGADLYIYDFCEGCNGTSSASLGDITFSNNKIYNVAGRGVDLGIGDFAFFTTDGAAGQARMGMTTFSGNTIDSAAIGISLALDEAWTEDSGTVTIGNTDFLDNVISNVTDTGIAYVMYGGNANPGTASLGINRPLFRDNTISAEPGGAQHGIYLLADISESVTFGTPEITGNTVNGFAAGILLTDGIYYSGLAGADIQANTVQNNATGLLVESEGSGYTALCNSFTGNSDWGLAVGAGYAAMVNAENNWWGDAEGPTTCAACNGVNPGDLGSVDFTPWLKTAPDKTSLCGGSNFPWTMFLPAIINPRR